MAEITPATPIDMIVYYAGLRDEYEHATGKSKDLILMEAKVIFENEVHFDDEGNLIEDVEDGMGQANQRSPFGPSC